MSGISRGRQSGKRVNLPDTMWIGLTEAITWLAFEDCYTDERWEKECPADGPLPLALCRDQDDHEQVKLTIDNVLECLSNLARTHTIELEGARGIGAVKHAPRYVIPSEVFEDPISWGPGIYLKNGFCESLVDEGRPFNSVYILRTDVLKIAEHLKKTKRTPVNPTDTTKKAFKNWATEFLKENGYPPTEAACWKQAQAMRISRQIMRQLRKQWPGELKRKRGNPTN